MTRKEMLSALEELQYSLIWPGQWEDVGFTERELWINHKGYGFIMSDEPTQCWEGTGVGSEQWAQIKLKIQMKTLSYVDIKGTALEDMLNVIFNDYPNYDDGAQLCSDLSELAMTDYPERYFYAMATIDGIKYFDNEAAFKNAFERDWAEVLWAEMDDGLLSQWIERLGIIAP